MLNLLVHRVTRRLTYATGLLTSQLYSPSKWKVLGLLCIRATVNLDKLVAVTASCEPHCSGGSHTSGGAVSTGERRLLRRKCHFRACGFFPIDITLPHSMTGSTTTYTVLLQHTGQKVGSVIEMCNKALNNAV
jgi:hypothetical protein